MNYNFNLRDINKFNSDHIKDEESKKNILNIFNLNKYKYLLNILKDITVDDASLEILEKEKLKVIKQANINFIINDCKFSDSIKVGINYFLYKNKDNTHSIFITNPEIVELKSVYIGCFELREDLTWYQTDL